MVTHRRFPFQAAIPYAALILVGIFGSLVGGHSSDYESLFFGVVIFCLLAQSFNVIAGYGGLLAVGNVMFFGFGGYIVSIGTVHSLFPPLIGAVIAILFSAGLAYVLGRILAGVSGLLFALITFGITISLDTILTLVAYTGGAAGPQLPLVVTSMTWYEAILHLYASEQIVYLVAAIAIVVIVAFGTDLMARSRWGQGLVAVRDDRVLAGSCGIDVPQRLATAWAISAAISAVAGVLYVLWTLSMSPDTGFGLSTSTQMLVPALVGGLGTVFGPVVGSVVLLVAALLQNASSSPSAANLAELGYAAVLLIVVRVAPGGILGWFGARRRKQSSPGDNLASQDVAERPSPVPSGLMPSEDRPALDRTTPLLKVKELAKFFGGVKALRSVSFEVYPGEVVALVGPNGAGKSTLFNCITGLTRATSGEIVFRDKRIDRLGPHKIARLGISRTYQTLRVLPEQSISQNVSLPILGEDPSGSSRQVRVADATRAVGLFAPLDTIAGALSIAEQRLVELARAVISGAELILLDESMVGLSRSEGDRILDVVGDLRAQGTAFVIVEHTMGRIVPIADRVIVTHGGTVIADGDVAEVMASDEVVKAYFGAVV
jgi:ABC-type branched-subunit amino acid transport system ATPase component/ABC-type branched-subunit amino acid transport system permease subunit